MADEKKVVELNENEVNEAAGGAYYPGTEVWYTIQWGDTLSGIALSFRTTVAAIMALNPGKIIDPNVIKAGDRIRVL